MLRNAGVVVLAFDPFHQASAVSAVGLMRRQLARWAAATLIALLAFHAGCQPDDALSWNAAGEDATAPAPPSSGARDDPTTDTVREVTPITGAADDRSPASVDGREIILIQVKFDVLRTRGPEGLFSGNGLIWNHLDEDILPIETRALLSRNGLRAARGRLQSWPPIKAILDKNEDITTSHTDMSVSNGLPLAIEVDAAPRDQVLFMYRADGSGAGFTYPDCMNHLRVEYRVPSSEPRAVRVTVMPELRLPQDPETIEVTPETWHLPRSRMLVRVFRELAFEMTVGPDEFFAVGPSPSSRDNKHLPGALLLYEEAGGKTYESMYFITPAVLRENRIVRPE